MIKKFVVWGYWAKNFGDDLLLIALREKLGHENQYIICAQGKYAAYYEQLGFFVVNSDNLLYKLVRKIGSFLKLAEPFFWQVNKKNCFIMLGGSLFAENHSHDVEVQQLRNLSYAVKHAMCSYVIGSNFGPYKTEWFFEEYEKLFRTVDDVCFRDIHSYSLFSSRLPNVRFSFDVSLEGEWEKYVSDNDETYDIVISVIDLSNRQDLQIYTEKYEEVIGRICSHYCENKMKVALLELCNKEGDGSACGRILRTVNSERVKYIPYTDIGNAFSIIKNCKKIYATRFHAVMMGLFFHKEVIPIIYNEKTINALETYSYGCKTYSISDVNQWDVEEMISCDQVISLKSNTSSQFTALRENQRG